MKDQIIETLVALTSEIYRHLIGRWPDYSVREYEMKVALAYRIMSLDATPAGEGLADAYAAEESATRGEWAEAMVSQELYMLTSLKQLCGFADTGSAELDMAEDAHMVPLVNGLAGRARGAVPMFTDDPSIQAKMNDSIDRWEMDALTIAGSQDESVLDLESPE